MPRPLPDPCLCLVTNRGLGDGSTLVGRVADAVLGGVDLVQIREKDLPGARLLELARRIRAAIGDSALLLINERVDVVEAVDADGVQLGEESLPESHARRILGSRRLIGRSVHSLEGALRSQEQGADFLLVGTMFASRSHAGEDPVGPGLVQRIRAQCSLPLIGIGGIDASNAGQVIGAGANGVAVISSILTSRDPQESARRIKQAILAAASAARAT